MNSTADLSILTLITQASPVVQVVLAILILLSLMSWTVIFRKFFADLPNLPVPGPVTLAPFGYVFLVLICCTESGIMLDGRFLIRHFRRPSEESALLLSWNQYMMLKF